MKILFVGDMRSPFIKQDYDLLRENHQVELFDLAEHATSFRQIPKYLIDTLFEAGRVRTADTVWIWFADYPALPFMIWSKLFRTPAVVNVGGWEVYGAKEIHYGNQLNPVRGAVTRWILRNVSCSIVMSRAYQDIILKLVPSAIVNVIPGWIDTSLCNEPLPLKKEGIVTAYCTRSTYTLKALGVFDRARLFIPGMKKIKNVPHEQLMHELQMAKIYCQLSYTESFGMTLLEVMACECVPVVTDRDALPEVIGETGLTVPYGDVEKTIEAIRQALEMDGGPARERARTFSKERRQNAIEMLLEEAHQRKQERHLMTDAEWILYCLLAAAALIIVAFLMHDYPIHDAINQTRVLMTGGGG